MLFHKFLMATAVAASLGIVSAAPIAVTGSSNFNSDPAGVLGNWTHTYSVGDAQVFVTEIKITLDTDLLFDTALGLPGQLLAQNVATTNAGGTGFTAFSALADGGTVVTLTFGDFNPGETYTHVGDVDQDCSGLVGVGLAACNLGVSIPRSLVTGAEFAGSSIMVTLDGPNVANPVVLSANFVSDGGNSATAQWTGVVNVVPEPSTYALMGAGLAGLIGFARRRRA